MTNADIQKFHDRVNRNCPIITPELGNCWIWTAGKTSAGYGAIWIGGKQLSSHCVSFEIANGKPLKGLWILHKCDNRPCVRPDHLFTGTQKDNMQDCSLKGRAAFGELNGSHTNPEKRPGGSQHYAITQPEKLARGDSHGNTKVSDAQVAEIRQRNPAVKMSQRKLGEQYGISQTQVGRILRGVDRKTFEL